MEQLQPYEEALKERMIPFEESFDDDTVEEGSESECDDWAFQDYVGPGYALPQLSQTRLINLSVEDGRLLGTNLAGVQLFSAEGGDVLQVAAQALGAEPQSLQLLQEGQELHGAVLKQQLSSLPVLVCERRPDMEAFLTREAMVMIGEELPTNTPVQAVSETRTFVTGARYDCWLIYTKLEVLLFQRPPATSRSQDLLRPLGFFPLAPSWSLPPKSRSWGDRCDVWTGELHLEVKELLDRHAKATNDRPIPRYQMIVDPNQFVRDSEKGPVWVPCDFDVDAEGRCRIVGGSRCHQFPALASAVAQPVLEAALPLLAKLRRPQLLLEKRRLQVVFKAQRIILPPKLHEDHESEYAGMWHVDGHREDVVAVVLYYYHVDTALQGGAMEFCGREPMDLLSMADAGDTARHFTRQRLREAVASELPRCKVAIKEGLLLVFSNYQLVHRVLRMVNGAPREASRDFVALFVLNPNRVWPAARHVLAGHQLLRRSLPALTPDSLEVILALLGWAPDAVQRRKRRDAMLREQLTPTGKFLSRQNVYATGNGCVSMVGWLHHMLKDHESETWLHSFCDGYERFRALDGTPKQQGRGMSEILSSTTSEHVQ